MTEEKTFTCAKCGETFIKAWTDAESVAERERVYGTSERSWSLVCHDCYQAFMKWYTELRAKQSGMSPKRLEILVKIQEEGDVVEPWESSGYRCFMKRNPTTRTWCGYVVVPPDHPWHGLAEDDDVSPLRDFSNVWEQDAPPVLSAFVNAFGPERPDDGSEQLDLTVRVHGGITCARPRRALLGESDDATGWVFGFDCAHAGDLMPGIHFTPLIDRAWEDTEVYRDRDYVFGETSRLAAQLKLVQDRGYR